MSHDTKETELTAVSAAGQHAERAGQFNEREGGGALPEPRERAGSLVRRPRPCSTVVVDHHSPQVERERRQMSRRVLHRAFTPHFRLANKVPFRWSVLKRPRVVGFLLGLVLFVVLYFTELDADNAKVQRCDPVRMSSQAPVPTRPGVTAGRPPPRLSCPASGSLRSFPCPSPPCFRSFCSRCEQSAGQRLTAPTAD